MNPPPRIAIVGASLSGLTAAKTLRACGHTGEIVVFGDETHWPYDRPPLSKEIVRGEWDHTRVSLVFDSTLDVQWRLGVAAVGLDSAERAIWLANGESERFDGIVIATGARPRTLSHAPPPGVHVLRTLDDALSLRASLCSAEHVGIVGAGFIGQEIAASCRQLKLAVTLLDIAAPAARAVGPELANLLADLHRSRGVDVRTGIGATGFSGGDRLNAIVLSDGSQIEANVAVVGIGVRPNIEWLADSALSVDDGVLCDENGLAAPGIVAAGDVARWSDGAGVHLHRGEQWDSAVRQADHAARRLLQELGGPEVVHTPVIPWFWSDMYGMKFQMIGSATGCDELVFAGEASVDGFVALFRKGDRLAGAAVLENTRKLLRLRPFLTRNHDWADVLRAA